MHRHLAHAMQPALAILSAAILLTAGCEKIGYVRVTLPDMGPQLPMTAALSFDPGLASTKFTYTDGCGHPGIPVFLGKAIQSALTDAADQTFKAVRLAGDTPPAGAPADVDIQVVLQQQGFKMNENFLYDRVPAELMLEATAVYRNPSGKVLGEIPLKVTFKDRIFLAVDQRRCDLMMDRFVSDATVNLAILFAKASRDVLDPASLAAGGVSATGQAPRLTFKTTVVDENGNAMLEGGERVKVRVELTNSGREPVTGIAVTLSGAPVLLSSFASPELAAGGLQPGESRAVEFAATLPQTVDNQKEELTVTVRALTGSSAPPPQFLTATLRSSAGRFDSIDQIPASTGLQRPHTYVLAVGVSAYRDPQLAARKYAALDAELTAAYFQAVGGVPIANIRLLQDWKALRPDIEDTILEWLPKRLAPDSVVIVYFSGHAAVTPTGDTYLIPYEGSSTSTARLYPLKDLEAGLARLKARQTIFIFDGGVLAIGPGGAKRRGPTWSPPKSQILHLIGTAGLQSGLDPTRIRHGLFTYYLLRGLRGEADANFDGEVTLGELTAFISRAVPAAARQDFNQAQTPLVIPPLLPSNPSASLVLSKSATK